MYLVEAVLVIGVVVVVIFVVAVMVVVVNSSSNRRTNVVAARAGSKVVGAPGQIKRLNKICRFYFRFVKTQGLRPSLLPT
jgi:NADH:ubiquinone oxidoreductase subunit H